MVDFAKKTVNTDKFRSPAIHFQNHGVYCFAPIGTTEYITYWEQEQDRCLNGYTADDGDWISGYHYFYLNYCPILRLVETEITDRHGNKKIKRERQREFPDFYDYDYNYFQAIQEAEDEGKHMVVLKRRGAGYSFKGASMLTRNYYHIPESKSYAIAAEKEFLTRDGLLSKSWSLMDFIDEHTAWAKKRTKSTELHRRSGVLVKDEYGNETEVGYKSEIIGVTLKNDPNRARGKRGQLILWEESGSFSDILQAWQIARPSVEEDGVAFGTMIAFGCVCAGTKVWTSDGRLVNIEDIKKSDGIAGYNTYSCVPQEISHFREPYDAECYRITLNSGKIIECSHDHPIVFSRKTMSKRVPGRRMYNEHMKYWKWQEAKNFVKGDQVGIIDTVNLFGNERMWNPRLVGWLIGDGSYGYDKTHRLFNCESEINSYIDKNFDTVIEKSYDTKDGKKYRETRIKNICGRLRDLGIYGQTKDKKRLPELIWSCDKDDVRELIGGLFDADGYVSKPQNKTMHRITLTSAHKELLIEVMHLLNKLGIHSKITFIKPNPNNPIDRNGYFRLNINDIKSLKIFADEIKLFPKEKQDRLDFYKKSLSHKFGETSKYISGIRFERVVSVESIGVKKVYNLTADDTNTYIANGIITHNTGGDEGSKFDGLKEMFYNPSGYNIKSFNNIWDEGADGTQCGFFVPVWANMSVLDEDGNRLYMDNDGNSLRSKASEYAMSERLKVSEGASNSQAIDRYVAENPMTPQEACLELTGNIFPKKELMTQLSAIRVNKKLQNHKQVGDLVWVNGEPNWQIKKGGDITKYPLGRDDDHEGSIVIWEHPMKDAPHGLYIAGCLTPGEKVLTDNGLKNVEDVNHLDRLINESGEPVKIKVFQKRYKENHDTYRITPYGSYRSTNFTEEHPILINNTPNNLFIDSSKFELAKDLKVGDWLKIPNRYAVETTMYIDVIRKYFDDIDPSNPLFWWFLGVWLGDGFNNKNGNSHDIYIAYGLNQSDSSSQLSRAVRDLFNRKTILCKSNGGNTRRFTHKALYEFLESEFGKLSTGKRIPEWAKYIPSDLKKWLIIGYLDSDGSAFYDNDKLRVNFTSINLELLESIQDILYSIGVFNSITRHSKKTISIFSGKEYISKESYRLSIFRKYIKDIIPERLNDFILSEKARRIIDERISSVVKTGEKAVVSSCGNYIYIQISKIEKSKYTGTVYNFECDTHTYMCRNIVTHNCDPLNLAVRVQLVRIGQNRWTSLVENTEVINLISKGKLTL